MEDRERVIPRQGTGLRSRRELGSFYMRRKENGEMLSVGPTQGLGGAVGGGPATPPGMPAGANGAQSTNAGAIPVSATANSKSEGKKFAPRRAPSFARGISTPTSNQQNPSQRNPIFDTFSKLSPQERQQLVEGLEKRMQNAPKRRSLPRPRSKSVDLEDGEEEINGKLKEGKIGKNGNRLIEDPVEVSNRSNLSDFSDAEEVESEELEGEVREVGEEVERWLNEGMNDNTNGPSKLGSEVTSENYQNGNGACTNCDDSAKKIAAMESAMSKMQAEMAELRVKLRKSEKKSKGWGRYLSTSSKSKENRDKDLKDAKQGKTGISNDPVRTVTDLELLVEKLTARLEDTEMERDQYMEVAKLHLQQAIEQQ